MPIPSSLSLAIALGGVRVRLPIGFLIIGMFSLPLSPAVAHHLRVQRIGLDFLPVVVGAATTLAFRLAANTLLKSVRRGLKNVLAIWAATGRDQCGSSELRNGSTSEDNRSRGRIHPAISSHERYDKDVLRPDTLGRLLRQNAAILIGILTLIVLAIHPIPECVACEYSNPWGRNDAAYLRDSNLLDLWLVLASFCAALSSLKRSWLVPVGIVFAHAATQFRGGVTWASFSGNEGPVILIMGIFVGGFSLMAGHFARHVYQAVRHKLTARRA